MEEVLELKHADIDVNPDYADSLDVEIFAVHLMFESSPELLPPLSPARPDLLTRLPAFPSMGLDAFEAGLDEVLRRCSE
jgi:hypothetical protein